MKNSLFKYLCNKLQSRKFNFTNTIGYINSNFYLTDKEKEKLLLKSNQFSLKIYKNGGKPKG